MSSLKNICLNELINNNIDIDIPHLKDDIMFIHKQNHMKKFQCVINSINSRNDKIKNNYAITLNTIRLMSGMSGLIY